MQLSNVLAAFYLFLLTVKTFRRECSRFPESWIMRSSLKFLYRQSLDFFLDSIFKVEKPWIVRLCCLLFGHDVCKHNLWFKYWCYAENCDILVRPAKRWMSFEQTCQSLSSLNGVFLTHNVSTGSWPFLYFQTDKYFLVQLASLIRG